MRPPGAGGAPRANFYIHRWMVILVYVVASLRAFLASAQPAPVPSSASAAPSLVRPAVTLAPALSNPSNVQGRVSRAPARLPPPAGAVQGGTPKARTTSEVLNVRAEQIPVGNPPVGPPAGPVRLAPVQINLPDAIELGLRQNPDIITVRRNEGVAIGVLGVAETYPFNPFVQVNVTPLQTNNGTGSTIYNYVLMMQTIQLAHQQQYREEVGGAALNSVRWNIVQAELLNVAMTERLFFTALYQHGLRDLAMANAAMNDELLRISTKQFEAGQISAANLAIIQIDHRASHRQERLAEANYQTAMLDLRRQLNISLAAPLDVMGDLDDWWWAAGNAENLLHLKCPQANVAPGEWPAIDELAASRPDVMAARADVATARAAVRLANANRTPDIQAGPYYQRTDNGVTFFGFRLHRDLNVWNDFTPMLRQRQAEQRQRQTAMEQLQARARIEIEAAINRYERARWIINETQDLMEYLPREIARLEEQFKAGEVDVVQVMQARTSLINARRANLDCLNELAQASAVLTATTAVPPQAIVQPAQKP
ncbi:MAG TPA: TolC family protein [Pirellulales bacterium]|nr:TolC family protein [Pirellulales bacterium]